MKLKSIIFLALLFILITNTKAQTVVVHENFEAPSYADSLISNPTNAWSVSSSLAASGSYSDTCTVIQLDTAELITNSFSTLGMTYVVLEFDQICKVEFFDHAEIYY